VTQHLGDYQAQAAKHAADAYNIQKRLSAEWDHAKESLGAGLLPQISKYGLELSNYIDKGTKSGQIQHELNTVVKEGTSAIKDVAAAVKLAAGGYEKFSQLVGGNDNAAKILAESFTLLYVRSKLIKWGIIEAGIKGVGAAAVTTKAELTTLGATEALAATQAVTWKREAGGAMVVVGTNAKAASVETVASMGRIKTAMLGVRGTLTGLVSKPWVIAVALSFIPPNKKGQDLLNKEHLGFLGKLPFLGGAEQQLAEAGNKTGQAFSKAVADVLGKPSKSKITPGAQAVLQQTFAQAKLLNPDLTPATFKLEQQIAKAGPRLKKPAHDVGATIAKNIADGIKTKDITKASADTALTALKSAAAAANTVAAQQLADARYQVTQARDTLTQAIKDSKQAVADSIQSAKQNLNQIAASIAGDAAKSGANPPLGGVLGQRLKELQARIKGGQGGVETQRLAQELQNQIAVKANEAGAGGGLDVKLANLADLFNRGSIGKGAAIGRLDQILKSAGVNAAVIQRGQGVAAADQFRAEVAAFKAQIRATAAGPQGKGTGFEVTIVKPLEVLRAQQKIIATDAHSLGTMQLGVQRAGLHVQQIAAEQAKKANAILAKIEAKLPSKHDSAALQALLNKQPASKTAADARAAAHGRHGG